MLIRAYLPQIMTALFGGFFVAAGIFTFGNAFIFDRLYLAILIFTAFICRKNINVVGIIVILLFERIFEETLWFFLHDIWNNIWFLKAGVYLTLGALTVKLWHDPMSKIALSCLVFSLFAEFYWHLTDYEKVPSIYWHNIIIGQSLVVRYLLFSRIGLTYKLLSKHSKSINLDWFIYQITSLYIVVEAFNIFEYLLRHIAKLLQVQFVYTIYPYVMQSLATFTLWIVFNETNKLIKSRFIKA